MRTIKFRAWDKVNNRFIWLFSESVLKNIFSQSHSDEPQDVRQGRLFNRSDSEYELSQFTGLYDRNGKEIYEGDVVEFGTSKVVVKYEEDRKVEYGHGDCSETLFIGFNIGSSYGKDNKPKVIGNVYENPELVNN